MIIHLIFSTISHNISVTCSYPSILSQSFSQFDVFCLYLYRRDYLLRNYKHLDVPSCRYAFDWWNKSRSQCNGFILDDDNYLAQFLDLAEIFINDKHFLHQLKLMHCNLRHTPDLVILCFKIH